MTELEQLNERITQLTELVKTGSKAIKSMEAALRAAEEERDRLADRRRGSESKFERVGRGKGHSYLFVCRAGVCVDDTYDAYSEIDNEYFSSNNYFKTKERAQEVADKINLLLKLERLHDTFCPNYMPDFNDEDATKWYLFVSVRDKKWHWEICHACVNDVLVYFSSAEIAQKVCDILNAELKEENEGNCNE